MRDRPLELMLETGTLWERAQAQTQLALACGALQPIDTQFEFLEHEGMRFLVRILANLARKEQAQPAQPDSASGNFNPFLPYEEDLFVSFISPTHLCLLNKYNVVDHHLLIVTRAFETQDSWLNTDDFEALWACLTEIDGLGFYNGGSIAGASQRHKHLQLVPLPLCPDGSSLPLSKFVQPVASEAIATVDALPFQHAVLSLPAQLHSPEAGVYLQRVYQQLLRAIGIDLGQSQPDLPYNLLITRRWMVAVPRSQDRHRTIPVNALGFAGSLLVKNTEQLSLLQAMGPMNLLRAVGYPT